MTVDGYRFAKYSNEKIIENRQQPRIQPSFESIFTQYIFNQFQRESICTIFELKNIFVKVSEKKKFPQKVESFIFDKNQFGCKKSFYIFQFQTGHELISKMERQIEQWLNYQKQKVV
ncbi:Hypothetical_protein [Hexamita inflata]|uniref:Hypothetical_protein n=1 Tax=Hexamita inflata TaxID=28002 RepID=A0ABP1JEG1_9EUKA